MVASMHPKFLTAALGATSLLLALSCRPNPGAAPTATLTGFRPPEGELVQPVGFPSIYPWMLTPDLVPAHWLGAKLNGKELVEPLNVIFVDRRSTGPEEARTALISALVKAGFPYRTGHSGGYYAFVDGRLQPQFPSGPNHAFSDEPFEFPNNHGRVFGPISVEGHFVFVAAFSRESVAPLDKVKHRYASFNRARDTVADCLEAKGEFTRKGFVELRNNLVADPLHCTGDHDGLAVLLERR